MFCQNPSLVLSLFSTLLKIVIRIRVFVDAHHAGLFPKEGRSAVLGFLTRYIQRRSYLTIVTKEALKKHVEKNWGSVVVLPDKIPNIPIVIAKKLTGENNLLFICSDADDEP